MTCPLCGEVCSCLPDARPLAISGSRSPVEHLDDVVARTHAAPIDRRRVHESNAFAATVDNDESPRPRFVLDRKDELQGNLERAIESGFDGSIRADETTFSARPEDSVASRGIDKELQSDLLAEPNDCWREEVSARLNRYRARRRPRAPRYPSLRLKFDTLENSWAPSTRASEAPALAARHAAVEEPAPPIAAPDPIPPLMPAPEPTPRHVAPSPASETSAKIIEFPKWTYTPPVRYSDLAEPVIDRPRILEAPEIVPPPPALGGITIEEEQKQEPARRPGIDMPLQSAPLQQRLLAVAIDVVLVLLGGGVFASVYYRVAGAQPTVSQILGLTGGMLTLFWITYQFLLIVYSGTTPGLRAMKLQLQRFDGSPTNRNLRRWRVLGSVLSAISLGMGYAWQFLDEDGLCWHERVTKTYLAPEKTRVNTGTKDEQIEVASI